MKHYTGYNDDDVIRPLCKKLPQMIGYVKHFKNNDSKDTITMSFNVNNNRLLEKNIEIWGKVSSLVNKEFDSDTVYRDDDKYIKTEITQYKYKINTNFQSKKMPKERESYECLSLIMLESVIKRKKYYPQTLLEECKYEIKKKKKMENLIDDDFDLGSSDESDNEESNEPE